MPKDGDQDTAGKVWSSAPYQSRPMTTGSIQGVWLFPGEEVEWTWDAQGKNIIGYTCRHPGTGTFFKRSARKVTG